MRFGCVLAIAFCTAVPTPAQQVRRDDLKPGLVFQATDANGTTFTRLESAVGMTLLPGEAAHPQSDGGTIFTWTSYIQIITAGKYTFDAEVLGTLTVTIGTKEVFNANVPGETARTVAGKEIELEPGIQKFVATLTRQSKGVRAALRWVGPGFRKEPVPYFFFGHTLAQRPASFTNDLKKEHGRLLFEESSCIRCHRAESHDAMAKTLAPRGAPNLNEIGKRAYAGWIDAWLKDPKKLRPHTAMPQLFTADERGQAQRYAVVSFLSSLGGPMQTPKAPAGNPNPAKKSLENGAKLYLTAGCAACHGENPTEAIPKKINEEDETEPLKPEDSLFGLGTASGGQSLYTLGNLGSKTQAEALAKYLEDPLQTNPHGRMPKMMLSGTEAGDIAKFLCNSSDPAISHSMPAEPKLDFDPAALVDPEVFKTVSKLEGQAKWKAIGQVLVTTMGCTNCHAIALGGKELPQLPALKLDAIRKMPGKGCASEKPEVAKQQADYRFDADQATALKMFLADGLTGSGSPSPIHATRTGIKRFNCLNCHNRDGEGGIDLALASKMKLNEKAENADDVQPPRITGVGQKMRTSWMEEVLLKGGRARPWMTLRMPQYGKENVGHLPASLPLLEGAVTDDAIGKAEFTKAKIEAGRTLSGKNGLGCISCHDISGQAGGGTRGPDLATTNQRVRYDWFVRWMHQPQRMVPGTKMPQVFLDGQSLVKTVHDGDGDKQLESLWAYFSLGPGLPLPSGMEAPKGIILAPGIEPEVMRTFLPDGAGTKGIAVGYPGGLNLAFDTQTNRLAYAWMGNFLDASPVWNARGGRPATVLGSKFYLSPPMNPWAITDSREAPDYDARKNDPSYGAALPDGKTYTGRMKVKFDGYRLDRAGQPTFQYEVSNDPGTAKLSVSENAMPVPITVANGITRRFVAEVPAQKTVWFLAGLASKSPRILAENGETLKLDDATSEGSTVGTRIIVPQVGDTVQVLQASAMPAGSAWNIAKKANGTYAVLLRLPENEKGAKLEFTLTAWALPKDDPQLIQGLK